MQSIPLRTREACAQHFALAGNGVLRPYEYRSEVEALSHEIGHTKGDAPVDEFLESHGFAPEERNRANDYVEGFHAAPVHRFGVRAFAAAESAAERIHGERAFRVMEGFGSLVRWKELEVRRWGGAIRYRTEVNRIRWTPGSVAIDASIKGKPERFKARAAVLTLPLGVLKSGRVCFDPPLPDKEEAVAALGAGHVTKVIFRFSEPFWPENCGFIHTFDDWLPTWWTNDDPLTLTAWAGGTKGERSARVSPNFLLRHALGLLARTFSVSESRVRARLLELLTHNWHHDPYSRMAYSYVPAHHLNATRQLAEPVAGTLFFAGEATCFAQNGTVHGALSTGVRAADEVEACLLSSARVP